MKTTVLLTVFVLSIVIQSHHGEEIPLAPAIRYGRYGHDTLNLLLR
uniref:Collagen triple helix repeat domain containing protein n=1 Tax=Haemonchus contortus TaxID=6289 RepID=A0A7I4YQF2_HAECO